MSNLGWYLDGFLLPFHGTLFLVPSYLWVVVSPQAHGAILHSQTYETVQLTVTICVSPHFAQFLNGYHSHCLIGLAFSRRALSRCVALQAGSRAQGESTG